MNNISKLLSLVGLISLVNFIGVNFPIFGGIILYLCVGYVVDQICIKIGQAEAEDRSSRAGGYKCMNQYKICTPMRICSYLIPPVAFLTMVLSEPDSIRMAFPQIPKFRNPFYYD